MPNPYFLLGGLVAAVLIFVSGFQSGRHWESADALAGVVAAQDAAIVRANRDAEAETQRALSAAKAEADARLAASRARHQGELDAARKANPLCNRDAVSLGLLNNAIRVSNGEKDATGQLPESVRPDASAFGWLGFGASKLGIQGGGSVRPMPAPAQ